ncbi:hypothetical protein WN943_002630 [Citrus x changshan-huyou]
MGDESLVYTLDEALSALRFGELHSCCALSYAGLEFVPVSCWGAWMVVCSAYWSARTIFKASLAWSFLCGGDDGEERESIHELGELNGEENDLDFDFNFDFKETTTRIEAETDPYLKFSLQSISRAGFYLDSKKMAKGGEESQLEFDFAVSKSGFSPGFCLESSKNTYFEVGFE